MAELEFEMKPFCPQSLAFNHMCERYCLAFSQINESSFVPGTLPTLYTHLFIVVKSPKTILCNEKASQMHKILSIILPQTNLGRKQTFLVYFIIGMKQKIYGICEK